MKKLVSFIRNNKHKRMSICTFLLSAYYRVCMLLLPKSLLQHKMGIPNEESTKEITQEGYQELIPIAYVVNRICNQTPWQSKCLVKALTAQHFLKVKGLPSTLYLGLKERGNTMSAHAWLRCGEWYVTGGDGAGYAVVGKFRA